MKITSILLMLLGLFMILAYGFMYLLGFAMSFDAPDAGNAQAWLMRLLMILPGMVLVVALIFAFLSFQKGIYKRSVLIGSVFPITGIGLLLYLFITSFFTMDNYKEMRAQEIEDARLHPVETYIRQFEGQTDSIIVFPSRIVSYRLHVGRDFPWAGPLGDLNSTRDTIVFNRSSDTKIKLEELYQFMDAEGKVFTNMYYIK